MTPDEMRLASLRKLDARCLDCNEGMAVTSRGGGGSAVDRKGTPRPRTSVTTPGKAAVAAPESYLESFGL